MNWWEEEEEEKGGILGAEERERERERKTGGIINRVVSINNRVRYLEHGGEDFFHLWWAAS